MAKDPILFKGHDTNLYGYCLSDPVNFTDSTGLLTDEDRAKAATYAGIGAVGGAALGLCTSAGIATLAEAAIGAGAGYAIGIAPGVWTDFVNVLNGDTSSSNVFNNLLDKP